MSGQIIGPIGVLPTGGGGGPGPFAIDGTAVAANSFASLTSFAAPSFSTNFTNEIIYCAVEINGTTVNTITDTAGLTWARRTTSFPDTGINPCELWSAKAPSLLSGNIITVNFVGTSSFISVAVCAFSGANFASPYDPNASVPNHGDGLAPLVITTTNATTIAVGALRTNNTSGDTITWSAGGGATVSNTGFLLLGWKAGPGAGNTISVISSAGGNGSCLDAITT